MSDQENYRIRTDKERTYVRASSRWKAEQEQKLSEQGLIKVVIDLPGGKKGSFWKRRDNVSVNP